MDDTVYPHNWSREGFLGDFVEYPLRKEDQDGLQNGDEKRDEWRRDQCEFDGSGAFAAADEIARGRGQRRAPYQSLGR